MVRTNERRIFSPKMALRDARVAAGMRQLDLAVFINGEMKLTSMTENHVSRWEHGRSDIPPGVQTFLAKRLNIRPADLAG